MDSIAAEVSEIECQDKQQQPTKPPLLPPKPQSLLQITNASSSSSEDSDDDSDDVKIGQPLLHTRSSSIDHLPAAIPSRQRPMSFHLSRSQTFLKNHENTLKQSVLTSVGPAQTRKVSKVYEDIQMKRRQLSAIVTDSSVLPMKVAFCDSIYGFCESFTFHSNELFDVHFLKKSTLANIRTSTGQQFEVPLQAPFQYTLDYPPGSICDVEYKAPQLMKLTYLPTVGIVKDGSSNRFKLRNKSSEFEDGEVLIFKGRIKSSTIECFSISRRQTKRLHKSSGELTLTTNPSQLTFPFTNLMFFDLPLQVKILAPPKLQPMFKSTSTVASLTDKKSLITSFADAKTCDDDSHVPLYEFLVDAPIDFQKTFILSAEKQKLIEKTEMIFKSFSPEQVQRVVTNANPKNFLQKQLYDTLTYPGLGDQHWKRVTELIKPETLIKNSTLGSPSDNDLPTTSNITGDDSVPPVEPIYATFFPDMLNPLPPVPSLPDTIKISSSTASSLSGLTVAADSLNTISIQTDPNTAYLIGLNQKDASHNETQEPKKLKVEDLSCDQVLSLLDKLGLSKYKNLFIEEKISGSILQELDEEMLEQDLGITSKLHRLKLRRVIEGREPLDSFFQ